MDYSKKKCTKLLSTLFFFQYKAQNYKIVTYLMNKKHKSSFVELTFM